PALARRRRARARHGERGPAPSAPGVYVGSPAVEVLSSRVLLRPTDLDAGIRFYRETLGLPVYREYGTGESRGVVFFLGGGFLEVSGTSDAGDRDRLGIWLQVRDLASPEK